MSKLIAVAGKGGTGKTTVAALVIRHLLKTKRTPVFAVDADPNYTLGEALGIEVEQTIGMMREEFIGERAEIPSGMSKEAVLERQMHAAMHEAKDVDLLVMGRQEGPGCYCYLNNVLRKFMDVLAADYPFVVVDNEAGMEHLSRRNTRKIDLLLVVCDHSVKAARAAGRIVDLVEELKWGRSFWCSIERLRACPPRCRPRSIARAWRCWCGSPRIPRSRRPTRPARR